MRRRGERGQAAVNLARIIALTSAPSVSVGSGWGCRRPGLGAGDGCRTAPWTPTAPPTCGRSGATGSPSERSSPVDVAIWPVAMRWHAGEQVRIEVSGHDPAPAVPELPERAGDNAGRHHLRAGGRYESYLLASVLPASE